MIIRNADWGAFVEEKTIVFENEIKAMGDFVMREWEVEDESEMREALRTAFERGAEGYASSSRKFHCAELLKEWLEERRGTLIKAGLGAAVIEDGVGKFILGILMESLSKSEDMSHRQDDEKMRMEAYGAMLLGKPSITRAKPKGLEEALSGSDDETLERYHRESHFFGGVDSGDGERVRGFHVSASLLNVAYGIGQQSETALGILCDAAFSHGAYCAESNAAAEAKNDLLRLRSEFSKKEYSTRMIDVREIEDNVNSEILRRFSNKGGSSNVASKRSKPC